MIFSFSFFFQKKKVKLGLWGPQLAGFKILSLFFPEKKLTVVLEIVICSFTEIE